jgi:hypothetical protein
VGPLLSDQVQESNERVIKHFMNLLTRYHDPKATFEFQQSTVIQNLGNTFFEAYINKLYVYRDLSEDSPESDSTPDSNKVYEFHKYSIDEITKSLHSFMIF